MRKIIYTLIAILGFAKTYAQAPLGIPYQAAARKANGQALTNTAIKVRFSILDSVATGTVAFKETHTTTTNALGMFNLNVGMGTAITGTLSGLNWGNNAKFLQVELDTTATGNNYSFMGVQQLMSVPYAMHSKFSESIIQKKISNDSLLYSCHLISFISVPTTLIIPENVYAIKVVLIGGGGGAPATLNFSRQNSGPAAGSGAYIKTILSVYPGDTLYLLPGIGGSNSLNQFSGSDSKIFINSKLIVSAGGGALNLAGSINYLQNGILGIQKGGNNPTYTWGGQYNSGFGGSGFNIEGENFGAGAGSSFNGSNGSNGIIYIEY